MCIEEKEILNFGVNEDILKDTKRIDAYREAIVRNKHLFKDKLILELDCGVGLFIIFALQAGAQHVFATNANKYTRQVLLDSKVEMDKVTLFEEPIKKCTNRIPKIDIIIAQWYGNLLLFNSNIPDVIFARNNHLKAEGIILPDKGYIYVQALEDGAYREKKLSFWTNVYGVKMNSIRKWAAREPLIESVNQNAIISSKSLVYELDLNTCSLEDLSFSNQYSVQIDKTDFATGLIGWFEVEFSKTHLPIKILQGTSQKPYYKPLILYFDEEIAVKKGEKIKGSIALKYHEDYLDIKLSCAHDVKRQALYFKVN